MASARQSVAGRRAGQWLVALSIGLAAGLLAVALALLRLTSQADQAHATEEVETRLRQVQADLNLHLAGNLRRLDDLARRVAETPLDEAAFRQEARLLMAHHPGIVRLSWYDAGARRVWSEAPLHATGALPESVAAVRRAAVSWEAFSPPFDLPEGPGFVVAKAAPGPDGPRGFVVAGYLAARLLASAHGEGDHDLALVGPAGELLAGRRAPSGLQRSAPLVAAPNGIQVVVSSRPPSLQAMELGLVAALALLGLGLAVSLRALAAQLRARRSAERAARESEARFREVADTAPVLIWMGGAGGTRDFFNRPWLEFRGRTGEEEAGDGWRQGVHPEDLAGYLGEFLAAFEARRPSRLEYRLQRQDGEHRWVLEHALPRLDAAGRFLGYIGSCVDISEHRQLEIELGRARFVLERSGEPVAWIAPDGRLLEVNEAACRHFRLSREELLARSVPDLDPNHPRERWPDHWRELVEKGSLTFESLHLRGDGSTVEVEVAINHVAHDGREFNCAFIRDISARKREERRLAESERRLRKLVDDLPAGAAILEADQVHINLRAAQITGYSPQELSTLDQWFERLYGDQAGQVAAQFEADRRDGFPLARTVELRPKDGHVRRVEFAAHTSGDDVVWVMHDVTDQEQATAALRASALQQAAILATTADGYLLVDLAGRLLEVNDQYCRLSGYSREELLTLSVSDLEAKETTEETARHLAAVAERGWDRFESRHRCKDGSVVAVEVSVTHVALLGRMICFVRDVTERRRAEQALRESEERHRSVVEALAEGVVVQAADGTVLACNAAAEAILGIPTGSLLGRTGLDPGVEVLDEDGSPVPRERHPVRVALRGGRPVRGQVLGYRPPGRPTAWISVNSVPLFANAGERPDGVVSTLVDVTASRLSDAQLATDARRLRFSLDLSQSAPHLTEEELLERLVEEAVALTGSQVAYAHRINDDQCTMQLSAWNRTAREACTATFATHYPLDEAGIWADSARQRAPVVHNDYPAEAARRGYPQGHFPVLRHASVPALDGGAVRLVLGVGNKREPYDALDTAQLQALATDAMRVMMRQRAERARHESEERYRVFLDNFQGVAWQAPLAGGVPDFVRGCVRELTGYDAEEFTSGRLAWDDVVVPSDRARRRAALEALGRGADPTGRVDYRIRRRDGLVRWVEELGLVAQQGAGPKVVQAAIYDVSAHRQAELRELHRREILELLARGAPLVEALEGIVRSVESERPGSLCSILLLEPGGRRLQHGAAPSLPGYFSSAVDGLAVGEGLGSCGAAASSGRRVVIEDLDAQPQRPPFAEPAGRAGLRSCWSEPVVSPSGEVLGVFTVYRRRPRVPENEEIRAVEGAARFAAIAIERSRADEALRDSEASLAALVERLAEANRVLAGVAGSQGRFISGDTGSGLQAVVSALVELTASARGLLSEVELQPTGTPLLRHLTGCGPGWERDDGSLLEELVKLAVDQEGALIVGDVGSDPRTASQAASPPLPPTFLGLPVRHGQELVGVVGLGGRWGGYSEELASDVSPLVATAATLIEAARAKRRHAAVEAELQQMLQRALESERRLTESQQAVRQAASEWVATFDAVEFAVLVVDEQGRVVRVNRAAAALAGADWGACLGQPVESLGQGEPWQTAAQLARSQEPDAAAPARQVRDTAGRFWDVDTKRAAGREGAPDRVIVSIRDVTNLVELTESVKRSETMAAMGSLVAAVAHEVRNPLFAMSVNIDALALELRATPEIHELVQALRSERDRISRLMEELLHFGRPAPARRRPGSLGPVLERAVRACAAHADQTGVALERTGSADGAPLLLDADRLEEVFQNLLDNACDHAPAGSRVVLGARLHPPGWVEVRVRDHGPGFPPEILPRAFEPFVTHRRGGIGLGLAIVQRIVDEHGGRVRASNPPDGGALVTVELPLLPYE